MICWLRARLRPRAIARQPIRPRVTVLIAAWREAGTIARKLESLAAQTYPAELVDVVVACDGSDDGTPEAARAAGGGHLGGRVTVLVLPERRGKPPALNAAAAAAAGEVLLMTDARQPLSANAIEALVDDLGDPEVGVAGGELVLGGDAPAGAYWKYEALIRKWEGRAGSTVGVSGALYAIRRALWQPMPDETILDDVLQPMRARLAGKRVVLRAGGAGVRHRRRVQARVRAQGAHAVGQLPAAVVAAGAALAAAQPVVVRLRVTQAVPAVRALRARGGVRRIRPLARADLLGARRCAGRRLRAGGARARSGSACRCRGWRRRSSYSTPRPSWACGGS